MRAVAGVDIGATSIRAGLSDDRGRLQSTATNPTPRDRDAIVNTIGTVLRAAADGACVPVESVRAVGIGSMGPLDHGEGCIVDPPNVLGVEQVPVVAAVEAVHDGPVVLHNDAVAAAIGERFYSDDPGENLVYLTISTGIGAGAIVDGNVLTGATGNAAELGHITVAPDSGARCGCGGEGHWEALCSGRAIPRTAQRIAEESAVETGLDLPGVSEADVFDAVGTDPPADRVVDRLSAWNALGVAAAIHAYHPARIHVGGAVATNSPGTVVDPLRDRVSTHVVGEAPPVAVTPLGSDAVLRGAVASVLERGARQ